jgi:hypothetical protein
MNRIPLNAFSSESGMNPIRLQIPKAYGDEFPLSKILARIEPPILVLE